VSEEERHRLGAAGRAYVVEHFDMHAVAKRYERLFESLAGDSIS
jgi:glycosyltransferase involved in cell wall biosynthesis